MSQESLYSGLLDESIINEINIRLAKPKTTIKEHTDDLLDVLDLLFDLGYIKDNKIYELVKKACIYHDIGKINDEFQFRVKKDKKKSFNDEKEISHNILSLYFIDESKFDSKEDYLKVANAVINHHDYCNASEILRSKQELINSLLDKFEHKKVKKTISAKISKISQDIDAIKIKGYLHKCDYCASAIDKYGNKTYEAEYINDFLSESLNNLLTRWKSNNLNATWNDLQNFCIENQDENIIAIAQTGMGKTEAGLLWIGDNKGFFILPIRTAINAIYDRIEKDILNIKDEKSSIDKINNKVGLLHSSSLEYLLLQEANKRDNKDENIEDKENQEILKYENTAKQLSLPLNISTLDQLFDFVYKYPTYELKLTTLSYSKLVIDEIQMYSPDLLAYLIYGIERIAEQGGKIAILTATLAPFVKNLLNKNIKFKIGEFTDDSKRHNLKVIDERIRADDIYEKYLENKVSDKSNKILVVCNSISESQNIYKQLKEKMNDINEESNLHILHAKFIRNERLQKEKEILDFGKTYKNEDTKELDKQSGIWISTSIVEASLDIDFDYLFTELQDINSLFQRFGRCNRKGKKSSDNTNCYIYTKIEERSFINGEKGYIDKTIFDLSKEAILGWNGQISESQKIDLINTYMTMDKLKDSHYIKEYMNIYNFIKNLTPNEFKANEVKLRNILSREIIPGPIYHKYLEKIKEIENQLNNPEIKSKDKKTKRIELQNELKKYTVSVHPSDIYNYQRALRNNKALSYKNIKLSDYEYIPVIDCDYGEMGYRKKNFDDEANKTNNMDDFML